MATLALYQVDAFTDRVFGGNPAAVCPLDAWPDDSALQQIAAENNLSETAFFVNEGAEYSLRWFTPMVEIDLCGHATLAAAHVILEHLRPDVESVRFRTMSGTVGVDKRDGLLEMNFPRRAPEPVDPPERLVSGLGYPPVDVLRSSRDYLAVFETEEQVAMLRPNFQVLIGVDCLGIIATAPGREVDFVSRFFEPRAGINEDPVTGSAHCTLVPYWSARLKKRRLHAIQVSNRRGELFCADLGDRVLIAGKAVTYLVGEISVPDRAMEAAE
jgi:PhzF family phenazine biosynthesis protein